ncbi:polysaccharide deacetylase family protein [Streptomyces orinoci]|uniref:Polysaccharide deacetylase family protein n=1 Tax=Streptomyces orinoci TaxID=67339 RepID=A0ABV3JRB3_STRON|nr:polysaccharide deacetylase family protein [Streptomyces orinoci]
MSGFRGVVRPGQGRHRRRRRTPLKAAAAVTALAACSAFVAIAVGDDHQDCHPPAGADGRAHGDGLCGARAQLANGAPRPGPAIHDVPGAPHPGASVSNMAPAPAPAAEAEGGWDRERCGNTSGRVLLSFDDWPYGDPERAVRIGAQLQSQGIRAAFFLINQYASEYPQIVTTLRRQGHWVGNHTWSHRQLTKLTDQEVQDEIRNGVAGNLLRPPYGDAGPRETEIAANLGFKVCNWTIDTLDWQTVQGSLRSPEAIRTTVREAPAEEKHNGVVLGHLFSHFAEALPGIISDLHEQGYQLCRDTGAVGDQVPYPLPC